MIKQVVILAQLLGLFFYQLFFIGDLTVTQNMPVSIPQGKETVVEIIIAKEGVSGFAKIQQDFPNGFIVEPIDAKGATFSFKDNKLKFIWMSLPEENAFTISYKITPDETVEGDFMLGGKFSFISENERKNIEIPVSNFTIVKRVEEDLIVAEEIIESSLQESLTAAINDVLEVEDAVLEDSTINLGAVEEEIGEVKKSGSTMISPVSILCKRTINSLGNGKYKVVLEISKTGVEGFCKITEEIPSGFLASEDNSNNGVFSFKGSAMKILWMGAPKEEVYSISYFIEANTGVENGLYGIVGFYSYLENDVTSKSVIDATSFTLNVKELRAEESVLIIPPTDIVEEVLVAEEANKGVEVKKPIVVKDAITSTPRSEREVVYKVQVGAGHEKVSTTYFATVFKLQDKVSTINHEGWIKYLVGSYTEYTSAKDKRDVVRGSVKNAFVTAYNSGYRITVQEALMISNQKWYK